MKTTINIISTYMLETLHKVKLTNSNYKYTYILDSYEDAYKYIEEQEEQINNFLLRTGIMDILDYIDDFVTQDNYYTFTKYNDHISQEQLNKHFENIKGISVLSVIENMKIESLQDWKKVTDYCKEKKIKLPLITIERDRIIG